MLDKGGIRQDFLFIKEFGGNIKFRTPVLESRSQEEIEGWGGQDTGECGVAGFLEKAKRKGISRTAVKLHCRATNFPFPWLKKSNLLSWSQPQSITGSCKTKSK